MSWQRGKSDVARMCGMYAMRYPAGFCKMDPQYPSLLRRNQLLMLSSAATQVP